MAASRVSHQPGSFPHTRGAGEIVGLQEHGQGQALANVISEMQEDRRTKVEKRSATVPVKKRVRRKKNDTAKAEEDLPRLVHSTDRGRAKADRVKLATKERDERKKWDACVFTSARSLLLHVPWTQIR